MRICFVAGMGARRVVEEAEEEEGIALLENLNRGVGRGNYSVGSTCCMKIGLAHECRDYQGHTYSTKSQVKL